MKKFSIIIVIVLLGTDFCYAEDNFKLLGTISEAFDLSEIGEQSLLKMKLAPNEKVYRLGIGSPAALYRLNIKSEKEGTVVFKSVKNHFVGKDYLRQTCTVALTEEEIKRFFDLLSEQQKNVALLPENPTHNVLDGRVMVFEKMVNGKYESRIIYDEENVFLKALIDYFDVVFYRQFLHNKPQK